ncbi:MULTISPECIES: FtsW/RodA/SpoVE family cell cycle protein [unclassified Saccharopolyspora]|uniref:FtsW/RodA/SpoVE family cell cycle protein n=1 Tax=unclassified Saccharopolyspora TaxID=2646250 RepID=UPI001CD4866B|nr:MULTISPECIES: FtsW/RodA/SpoVE family cell cycle protein [unclassified Saccharopolyspora]MCA1186638.1 FtsW/RodA/SpoVE family cell cycle protein [Saccharopolyspora sp. 6T]MCA1191797.1 FtsW/RodA/SpoVE family cell cycle protein [Saccharopolyspora sp. 6V]MCA1281184.1 FtsW/RodA/SpoVE family cell cycle protein [Saccharopolyspora sp. 7B]
MSQPGTSAESTSGSNTASSGDTRRGTELFLLVCSAVIVTFALMLVEISQENTITRQLFIYGAAYLALFGGAHVAVRKWAPYADPLMLPLVALLNGLGLVMIHRIDIAKETEYAVRQIAWLTLSLVLFALVLAFIKDHRVLAKYSFTCGFVGLVLLALPGLLPSAISEVNGAKLWIKFGPLGQVQPSEFAKILLMIFFASFLVSKRELFTTAGRKFLNVELPRPRDLMPMLVAWVAAIGIGVLEKDLGTSLLFFGIVLVMLYIATERAIWVVLGLSLFALGAVLAWQTVTRVQSRVNVWLDPLYHDDGYQLKQALYGLGSGGIGGTGLGNGNPEIVPFSNSDFIITSMGEELGLVGLIAIFLMYLLLMMRGLRSALAVRDSFGKLFGGGLSFTVALQLFVVAGGVTGLIPLTGLTAPFLAYGGSSLLANYILIAMLLRISDAARRPQTPAKPKPQQAPIAEAHTELVERPR